MSVDAVESLREDIRRIEESIREKERILLSRRRELNETGATLGESEAALKDAEQRLSAAQDEYRAVEAEKQALLPQYERCQQNKDHHTKAETYKRDIAASEVQLREADKRIKELEARLKDVSATYKNERERRMLMITRVTALVDDLRLAIERKLALTTPIDADGPSAQLSLNALNELTRERETAVRHWSRYSKELAVLVEMKKERALELKLDSEKDIAVMRAAKDEEIRQAVQRFEAEREALVAEIEDMRSLNEKQLLALRTKKIVSDKPVSMKAPTIGGGGTPRRESATPTERVLQDRSVDLEREKLKLVEQIREATVERQRLVLATKELRLQIEKEEQKHTSSVRNLENQILNEKHQITAIEKENKRLKDACDQLAASLRSGPLLTA